MQRRDDTLRDLGCNSIIDAVTLNSGIIILLYTIGKYFSIEFLTKDVDNYALLTALIISGVVIILDSLDKLRIISLPRRINGNFPEFPAQEIPENQIVPPTQNERR